MLKAPLNPYNTVMVQFVAFNTLPNILQHKLPITRQQLYERQSPPLSTIVHMSSTIRLQVIQFGYFQPINVIHKLVKSINIMLQQNIFFHITIQWNILTG